MGDNSPISGVSAMSWSTFHWFLKSKTGAPHWSFTHCALKMRPAASTASHPPTTHRATAKGRFSSDVSTPYSCAMRACTTSNCNWPTAAKMGSCFTASRLYITCTAPSPRSSVTPFWNCLYFPVSVLRKYANSSGENVGIGGSALRLPT